MPTEAEREQLEQTIRGLTQKREYDAFLRTLGENKRLRRNLAAIGEEPPPPTKGFLSTFLDALDTGGQWVRGGIASLLDLPGFENTGVLEAASRANAQDLTVGDLLRESNPDLPFIGPINEHPILRGVAGFAGDVITDPLSWLGGATAKIGTRAVKTGQGAKIAAKGDDVLRLAGGRFTPHELLGRQEAKSFANELAERLGVPLADVANIGDTLNLRYADDVVEQVQKVLPKNFNIGVDELDEIIQQAGSAAQRQAVRPFTTLDRAFDLEKKLKRNAKAAKKLGPEVYNAQLGDIARLKEKAATELGLEYADDINNIFRPKAIRIQSPLAGLPFIGSAKIPILGKSVDVPYSAEVVDKLGGALYNLALPVIDLSKSGTRKALASGNPIMRFLGTTMSAVGNAPSALSKRVALGGRKGLKIWREHDIARAAVERDVRSQVDIFTKNLDNIFGDKADDAYRSLHQAWDSFQSAKPDASLQESLQQIWQKAEQLVPGSGDEAVGVWSRFARASDQQWTRANEAGLLENYVKNYAKRAYIKQTPVTGIDDFGSAVDKAFVNANSLKARKFASMDEAMLREGYIPKFGGKEAFIQREIEHRLMLEEVDFLQRLAIENGVPRETYKAIQNAVNNKNAKVSQEAIAYLERLGIDPAQSVRMLTSQIGPDEIAEYIKKNPIAGAAAIRWRGSADDFLVPEKYLYLKNIHQRATQFGPEEVRLAEEEIAYLGLKFTDEEEAVVRQMGDYYKEFMNGMVGRAGEDIFSRSATLQLSDGIRQRILSSDLPDDVKQWYQGVLPRTVVQSVEESRSNVSIMKGIANGLREAGVKPVADALDRFTDVWPAWLAAQRYSTTHLWPAFHMRNLGGAQIMATQEAAILGEALSPISMLETFLIRTGRKKAVRDAIGNSISSKQLLREMRDFGVLNESPLAMVDIADASADYIRSIVPRGVQKVTGPPLEVIQRFGNMVENAGREHLYVTLRKRGIDALEAADEVARVMVDYSRGKTKLEKDLLNQIFFFYSFTRTSTANQLKNLVTRPGALTVQLHAIEGVKEMLRDPNAIPLPPEQEEQIINIRGKETVARYIGRAPSGNPLFLQQIGVPLEDTARLLGGVRIPEEVSIGGILDAVSESGTRTAQLLLSQTNPTVKAIAERLSGKNLFFNRPLSDEFLNRVPKLADSVDDLREITQIPFDKIPRAVWEPIDSAMKAALKGRDNGDGTIQVDPSRLALLTMLIPAFDRLRFTIGAATDPNLPTSARKLRLISGVKVQEVDPAKAVAFDEKQRLYKLAESRGVATNRALKERLLVDSVLNEK